MIFLFAEQKRWYFEKCLRAFLSLQSKPTGSPLTFKKSLCSTEKRKSYRFRKIWEWMTFHFGVNCPFKISHRKIAYGSKIFMNFNIRHFIFRATGLESKFGIKMAEKCTLYCHIVSAEPYFRYQTKKLTKQIMTLHKLEGTKNCIDRSHKLSLSEIFSHFL